MANVRATCPECREDVDLTTDDVAVVRYLNGEVDGSYIFRCPLDNKIVQKPAEERAIDLLSAAGCYVIEIDLSDPPEEIGEQRLILEQQGPMLLDEQIDLGLLAISREFDGLLE